MNMQKISFLSLHVDKKKIMARSQAFDEIMKVTDYIVNC